MSRVRIPLDLIDSSVTGIYMENLISCWCDRGLTLKHAEVLASVLSSWTKRDDLFIRCLEKEKSIFETTRGQIMRSLDIWEEVPAWDEVWRLKLAFDRDRKIDWHPNVKLYTVIVCKLLPEMIMERDENEHDWSLRGKDSIDLSGTPSWYREKVEQYQARQAEREKSRQRDQEAMLRYRALTRGAFINQKATYFEQHAQVPLSEDELERLLEEPRLYPLDWWAGLEKAGLNSWSYKPSDASPWQWPDFISRQQKEFVSPFSQAPATPGHTLGMSWKPAGFSSTAKASPLPPDFTSLVAKASPFAKASPLPPDFTSSAAKASPFAKASPLPPDFTSSTAKASPFAKASPLPPDFTSSAAKASPFAKASPLPPDFTSSAAKASPFATREQNGPPSSVPQEPEQVKSGGNLGATVADSAESEGSWEPPKFLLK